MPASRVATMLLVDELDRADVEAAGRLGGDEQPQVAAELAGEHDLLLVAAGEACRPACRCPGARTSNSVELLLGELGEVAELQASRFDERRADRCGRA